ncbi:LysM peptidoglycan-binding domain-containing protein [Leuconostoc falkenbergense]|uniref:LysM peptidoglycan-binding domain-containing protein n=1 Tax=Leuconostoc falkenbergense TaxID=2766470 RepID=UPI0024AD0C76|nr:LysM peptidoglycan-binding domain-containing protein [Leuconostoc falkenbergense]MDI6666569.1 LysM peptidoglycan-binding domain-containing protein [Leuconostoc falkenbergense]
MKKSLIASAVAASVVGGQVIEVSASTTYNVKTGDTLYAIALKNNLTVSEIKSTNHLNSNTIYSGQKLVLSKSEASGKASSTKITTKSNNTYTVKSGDTLSKIAANHHMSLSQIVTLNQISNANLLRIGQVLKIAGANATTDQNNAKASNAKITTSKVSTSTVTYTVKSGDTLSKIASSNKMTIAQLASLNKITNVNMIHVGQVLKVTKTTSSTQSTTSHTTTTSKTNTNTNTASYTVKSGDTLSKIAANHNMSLAQIAALNAITNVNAIRVGQVLKVSKTTTATTNQSSSTTSKTTTNTSTTTTANGSYKVNSGDTLYAIAAKLKMNINTLLSLNGLKLSSTIYVGQVLKTSTTTAAVTTEVSTTTGGTISTAGLTATQSAWLNTAVTDAKAATAGTGVLASITVAQAILESGWGQSALASAPYHNLFGIKQGTGWQGTIVNMKTSEYVNGKWVTVLAPFRSYSSQMASFQDHTTFLLSNSRYAANGVINAKNYVTMANGLQAAGYATAPTYASTLINLVKRYNLQALD